MKKWWWLSGYDVMNDGMYKQETKLEELVCGILI